MSAEFAAKLAALGVTQSVGRIGVCYDNALAESFFAVLKNERVHRRQYPTRRHAQTDIWLRVGPARLRSRDLDDTGADA